MCRLRRIPRVHGNSTSTQSSDASDNVGMSDDCWTARRCQGSPWIGNQEYHTVANPLLHSQIRIPHPESSSTQPVNKSARPGVEALEESVLYLVIAHFRRGFRGRDWRSTLTSEPSDQRSGLRFVGSWVDASLRRCFQIVDCNETAAMHRWTAQWRHCVDFEVVPVLPGDDAVIALQSLLD